MRNKEKCVFVKELHSPAMFILAGVAFSDAGVLVRLLLVGVTPMRGEHNVRY